MVQQVVSRAAIHATVASVDNDCDNGTLFLANAEVAAAPAPHFPMQIYWKRRVLRLSVQKSMKRMIDAYDKLGEFERKEVMENGIWLEGMGHSIPHEIVN